MTHPSVHARTLPNKIAYQMAGTGKAITYRELDELSNQGAQLFRSLGLKAGDHIALLMENRLAFMEICWAAQRSGLYYTAISRYLTTDEIGYIVKDCGAKLVITSPKCAEQIKGIVSDAAGAPLFYMIDEPLPGFRSWDTEALAQPTTPISDEEPQRASERQQFRNSIDQRWPPWQDSTQRERHQSHALREQRPRNWQEDAR